MFVCLKNAAVSTAFFFLVKGNGLLDLFFFFQKGKCKCFIFRSDRWHSDSDGRILRKFIYFIYFSSESSSNQVIFSNISLDLQDFWSFCPKMQCSLLQRMSSIIVMMMTMIKMMISTCKRLLVFHFVIFDI